MIKDAELHAEEDKRRKALADARNAADAAIYQTEKALGEMGSNLNDKTKEDGINAISSLRQASEGENREEIVRLEEVA